MIGVSMFGYFTVGSPPGQIHLLACTELGSAAIICRYPFKYGGLHHFNNCTVPFTKPLRRSFGYRYFTASFSPRLLFILWNRDSDISLTLRKIYGHRGSVLSSQVDNGASCGAHTLDAVSLHPLGSATCSHPSRYQQQWDTLQFLFSNRLHKDELTSFR